MATSASRAWALVLVGGFVAGALDIIYAWAFWAVKAHVSAMAILQSVAAGLLGKAAFVGGAEAAAIGLALHFSMATLMSVVYFLVAKRWVALVQRPLQYGPAYGLVLYGVMNYIVVPLSAVPSPKGPQDPLWLGLSVVAHMTLVGLPISVLTRRALT